MSTKKKLFWSGGKPLFVPLIGCLFQKIMSTSTSLCGRREKRIQKDIASVRALSLKENGVYADPTTFSLPEWAVFVQGPVESVWGGGVFKLKMSFPQGYPFDPIKINFAHGIFHPNVGSGGTICLDIIKKDAWSPSYTLVEDVCCGKGWFRVQGLVRVEGFLIIFTECVRRLRVI